jgi:SAM-dependent methyltransferase
MDGDRPGEDPDLERLMQRARDRVATRGHSPAPRPGPDTRSRMPRLIAADVALLHASYDTQRVEFTSHRSILGPLIVLAKGIVRQLLRPILERQVAYNAANTRVTSCLAERTEILDRLVQQLGEQTQTLASLETRLCDEIAAREALAAYVRDETIPRETFAKHAQGEATAREALDRNLRGEAAAREALDRSLRGEAAAREALDRNLRGEAAAREALDRNLRGEAAAREALDRNLRGEAAAREALDRNLRGEAAAREALAQHVRGESDARQTLEQQLGRESVARETAQADLREETRQLSAARGALADRVARAERKLRRLWLRLAVDVGATTPREHGASPASLPVANAAEPPLDYASFEDRFRGEEQDIRDRQQKYLPVFTGRRDVLDLGCGRGEFLELCREAGVSARGVDLDLDMVLTCRDKGLDVAQGDALQYVAGLPDNSLGGVFAAQFVEHLQPSAVAELVRLCHRKLRVGGRAVFETPNPGCLLVFARSFYADPTHIRPLHSDAMQFLLESVGFEEVTVEFSAPIETAARIPLLPEDGVPAVRAFNQGLERLNDIVFGFQDYAVIGTKARPIP